MKYVEHYSELVRDVGIRVHICTCMDKQKKSNEVCCIIFRDQILQIQICHKIKK